MCIRNSKNGNIGIIIIILMAFIIITILLVSAGLINLWIKVLISFSILILVVSIIVSYNDFVSLNQKVKQSESLIDVYLKQRFDLIPNIVETVKEYAKYEENVLNKIAEIRTEYENNKNENLALSAELNDKYNRLLVVIENYPELKANEGFLNLQKQLSKMENQLQAARRIYNSDVTQYNIKINYFPSKLIAKVFGFEEANLFDIDVKERESINI